MADKRGSGLLAQIEAGVVDHLVPASLLLQNSKNGTHLGEFDPMMEVKISRATQAEVLLAADHVDY
jgi:hypothetical protein